MNICYLVSNINPSKGGTERVTMTVSENLEKVGYNVYFVYTQEGNELIPTGRKLKIGYDDREDSLQKEVLSFIEKNAIKVLIVVNRVFQTSKYQALFCFLKRESGVKIIASLHASPDNWVIKDVWGAVLPKVYLKRFVKRIILKIRNPHLDRVLGTYRVVDKYLLLSKSYINSFKEIYPIEDGGQKLIAIPNPCPFADIYDGEEKKENIVLIVSRMQEDQKRIYAAIKIWSLLEEKFPDWNLVIVGDGPDLNTYRKMAKRLSHVSFVGHSNKVQDYYKRSKIFMMTSIWEGLPMTLIEGMHYGCIPVAFDNFSALHDLIENGDTGYIIPNNNIKSFAVCLSKLMSNEQLVDKISKKLIGRPDVFKMKDIVRVWDMEIKKLCES